MFSMIKNNVLSLATIGVIVAASFVYLSIGVSVILGSGWNEKPAASAGVTATPTPTVAPTATPCSPDDPRDPKKPCPSPTPSPSPTMSL